MSVEGLGICGGVPNANVFKRTFQETQQRAVIVINDNSGKEGEE